MKLVNPMGAITINLEDDLKSQVKKRSRQDGISLTFLITQALKAYNEGELRFGLIHEDDEVVASFDISTEEGKGKCLEDFRKLAK